MQVTFLNYIDRISFGAYRIRSPVLC